MELLLKRGNETSVDEEEQSGKPKSAAVNLKHLTTYMSHIFNTCFITAHICHIYGHICTYMFICVTYMYTYGTCMYRAFSRDVMAAILVFQNNEMVAMLVYQTSPVGVQLFSYADAGHVSENALFYIIICKKTYINVTYMKVFYIYVAHNEVLRTVL